MNLARLKQLTADDWEFSVGYDIYPIDFPHQELKGLSGKNLSSVVDNVIGYLDARRNSVGNFDVLFADIQEGFKEAKVVISGEFFNKPEYKNYATDEINASDLERLEVLAVISCIQK